MFEQILENSESILYALFIAGATIANIVFTIKSKPISAIKAEKAREKAISKLQEKINKEVKKVETQTKELENLKKEQKKDAWSRKKDKTL